MTAKYFSGSPTLVEVAAVLKAMADPNRLRILDLLATSESCHAELKEKLGLPPNLLSHHLGVLREAGLVQTRPDTVDARWIYYRADPAVLSRWRSWFDSFLDAARFQPRPALCGPEGQDKVERWPQPEDPAEKPRWAVLFLCSGNSCRSQMAEAVVNTRLGDRWTAVSAGTEPASRVHPKAVDTLAEIGIEWRGHAAKQADLFRVVPFDLVITLCDRARQHIPAWVKGSIHLGFPDPVQAEGTPEEVLGLFREVRDEVARQIPAFLIEWEKTHPYQN
jgi:protein-tyrosine-phosphatase/DNA-binding HxlR family transcriptional regulator